MAAEKKETKTTQSAKERLELARSTLDRLTALFHERSQALQEASERAVEEIVTVVTEGAEPPNLRPKEIRELEEEAAALQHQLTATTEAITLLELEAAEEALEDTEEALEPLRRDLAKKEEALKKAQAKWDEAANLLSWKQSERTEARMRVKASEERVITMGGPAAEAILRKRKEEAGLFTVTDPETGEERLSALSPEQEAEMQRLLMQDQGFARVTEEQALKAQEKAGPSVRIETAKGVAVKEGTDDG